MSELFIDDSEDLRIAVLGEGQATRDEITQTFRLALDLLADTETQEVQRVHIECPSGEILFSRFIVRTHRDQAEPVTVIHASFHEKDEEENPFVCFEFIGDEATDIQMRGDLEDYQNAYRALMIANEAIDRTDDELEMSVFKRFALELQRMAAESDADPEAGQNNPEARLLTDAISEIIVNNAVYTQYIRETSSPLDNDRALFVMSCIHAYSQPIDQDMLGFLEPRVQICLEDRIKKQRLVAQLLQNSRVQSMQGNLNDDMVLSIGPNYEGIDEGAAVIDIVGHDKDLFRTLSSALIEFAQAEQE